MTSPEELNKSSYQYIVSKFDQFEQICKPLTHLGISYFNYTKIFSDGSQLFMSNHLNFSKCCLATVKDNGSFLTQEIDKGIANGIKHGYLLLPTDIQYFDKNKDPIPHIYYDHNLWNIFFIGHVSEDGYLESYAFGQARDNTSSSSLYLNNLCLLERFIKYFKEKAGDLIDTSDKRKLAYFEQQFNFHNLSKETQLDHRIKQYLEATTTKGILIKGKHREVRLSARETECLQYLALGNSVKEIANILELSPRTIETYLKNTKYKTDYYSKSELVTNFLKKLSCYDFK